jgi:hypothetical protein
MNNDSLVLFLRQMNNNPFFRRNNGIRIMNTLTVNNILSLVTISVEFTAMSFQM